MPTFRIAELDPIYGQTIVNIFDSDNTDHLTRETVVIDAKVPMPDIGWRTTDDGVTFTPPAANSIIANQASIQSKAMLAIQSNADWLDRQAQPSPAQILTQVDRLTRQCTILIRQLYNQLDSQAGT